MSDEPTHSAEDATPFDADQEPQEPANRDATPAEQADEPADRVTRATLPRRAGSRRVPKIMIRQPEDTL